MHVKGVKVKVKVALFGSVSKYFNGKKKVKKKH